MRLALTDRQRRQLRGLFYGISIGGNLGREDRRLAAEMEKRLAPPRKRAKR